jgi:hypothetical protein
MRTGIMAVFVGLPAVAQVSNGRFENGLSSWQPAASAGGAVTVVEDSQRPGNHVVRLTGSTSHGSGGLASVTQAGIVVGRGDYSCQIRFQVHSDPTETGTQPDPGDSANVLLQLVDSTTGQILRSGRLAVSTSQLRPGSSLYELSMPSTGQGISVPFANPSARSQFVSAVGSPSDPRAPLGSSFLTVGLDVSDLVAHGPSTTGNIVASLSDYDDGYDLTADLDSCTPLTPVEGILHARESVAVAATRIATLLPPPRATEITSLLSGPSGADSLLVQASGFLTSGNTCGAVQALGAAAAKADDAVRTLLSFPICPSGSNCIGGDGAAKSITPLADAEARVAGSLRGTCALASGGLSCLGCGIILSPIGSCDPVCPDPPNSLPWPSIEKSAETAGGTNEFVPGEPIDVTIEVKGDTTPQSCPSSSAVVFAVDMSGSIYNSGIEADVRNGVQAAADTILSYPDTRAALVRFAGIARTMPTDVACTQDQCTEQAYGAPVFVDTSAGFSTAMSCMPGAGTQAEDFQTDISGAFDHSTILLDNCAQSPSNRVVLLFTDGQPTCTSDPCCQCAEMDAIALFALQHGMHLNILCYGSECPTSGEVYDNFANTTYSTGGQYQIISDIADLQSFLENMFRSTDFVLNVANVRLNEKLSQYFQCTGDITHAGGPATPAFNAAVQAAAAACAAQGLGGHLVLPVIPQLPKGTSFFVSFGVESEDDLLTPSSDEETMTVPVDDGTVPDYANTVFDAGATCLDAVEDVPQAFMTAVKPDGLSCEKGKFNEALNQVSITCRAAGTAGVTNVDVFDALSEYFEYLPGSANPPLDANPIVADVTPWRMYLYWHFDAIGAGASVTMTYRVRPLACGGEATPPLPVEATIGVSTTSSCVPPHYNYTLPVGVCPETCCDLDTICVEGPPSGDTFACQTCREENQELCTEALGVCETCCETDTYCKGAHNASCWIQDQQTLECVLDDIAIGDEQCSQCVDPDESCTCPATKPYTADSRIDWVCTTPEEISEACDCGPQANGCLDPSCSANPGRGVRMSHVLPTLFTSSDYDLPACPVPPGQLEGTSWISPAGPQCPEGTTFSEDHCGPCGPPCLMPGLCKSTPCDPGFSTDASVCRAGCWDSCGCGCP